MKTIFEEFPKGERLFRIWPYGAIAIQEQDGDGGLMVHHIGRHDLEDYKEMIELAIKKRDEWRKANGKD